MRVYQLVEYTHNYACDDISKEILHTFQTRKEAEKKLKEYENSDHKYYNGLFIDTWFEIEEIEIDYNKIYEEEINFILNIIKNDSRTQILSSPVMDCEDGVIRLEFHYDNMERRVIKLEFKVNTTLQRGGYAKRPFADGDWTVVMGLNTRVEFITRSELIIRGSHFADKFLYVVMPYISNNLYC